MAQLVARLHGMQKVRGSNPLSSTQRSHHVLVRLIFTLPLTFWLLVARVAVSGI